MPGWIEGVQKMAEGERVLFWIPEKLAYDGKPIGKPGALVYEIELLEILP
jgi:FKBP-type peptidyl-prolyl cis-trans isomerase